MSPWAAHSSNALSSNAENGNGKYTETALEWMQRCQTRKRRLYQEITDPASAAWAFLCGFRTEVRFIDQAMKNNGGIPVERPVIMLEGEYGVGKTWTLLTLAARFVVSTRSSRFGGGQEDSPHVIVFDPWYRFDMSRLLIAIRAAFCREKGDHPPEDLEAQVQNTLKRIHFIYADKLDTACVSLAALGVALKDNEFPSLLLWDDFLVDSTKLHVEDLAKVSSTLSKLQKEACVQIILSSSRPQQYRGHEVTHRIRMERIKGAYQTQHGFVARIQGANTVDVAYSIGQAGILT